MIVKVSNCGNCPFKIEDFGNEDEEYDTLIFCQLSKFLNRNLMDQDFMGETYITTCNIFVDDPDDITTPEWCQFEIHVNRDTLLEIIKKIQIDTIKETCQACADNAIVDSKKKSQYGKHRKWQKVREGEEVDLFSYQMMWFVDKSSILSVAEKLIKEL